MANGALMAGMRGTPPPSYDPAPVERLGLPSPAFTSKSMQQTRQSMSTKQQTCLVLHKKTRFAAGWVWLPSWNKGSDMPRTASPASPRPGTQAEMRQSHRSASPKYAGSTHSRTGSAPQQKRGPHMDSKKRPSSSHVKAPFQQQERPGSSHVKAPFAQQDRPSSSHSTGMANNSMAIQLASGPDDGYGSQGRSGSRASAGSRAMSYYGNGSDQQLAARSRSKSVADVRQFNSQGRPILLLLVHFICIKQPYPRNFSFAKGDILAVMTHQDDGWWEAEVAGKNGRPGLVPSNYLQNC
ncbi:hypothetical protein DID88_003420 [Monilinia fructigena]|uniref:SH3 domain-containing protein n=1 Tax=Monilinia fructigena TaxID=38457 RepID=A0A395ITZ8_9HELO|nr:hypothetical protein DID88_003420 [Monilinia fructigena]